MKLIQPVLQIESEDGHESTHQTIVPANGVTATFAVTPPVKAARAIVGVRIPFLPDFLEDHTLLGDTPATRLGEVLQRQEQLIQNLWKWQSAAFSLRYIFDPTRGAVDVILLARVIARREYISEAAQQLGIDIQRLMHVHGVAAEQLTSLEDLEYFRYPVSNPTIVEVRQYEAATFLANLGKPNGDRDPYVYVVHAYDAPVGTWLQLFSAMLRLSKPCIVNLHIEPLRLDEAEEKALTRVAAETATLTEEQRHMYSETKVGHFSDPQAGLVAQRYRLLLSRLLTQPFVLVGQVASKDEFEARSIASLLGAVATATLEATQTPAGFQVLHPRTDEEMQCARRTMRNMILTPWRIDPSLKNNPLRRLSYLNNAHGAAAIFRFPVAVRSGIPGIGVRQTAPDFDPGLRQYVNSDKIHIGDLLSGGTITLNTKELNRHGLISGLPGSGKTNTCLYILDQLRRCEIPFLVIEPAKTEYRGLLEQEGYEDLLVFTAGDETTSPFRLNPFQLLPGVRVEVHLEALNTAFNAVMPQFGILPSILEEALENAYARHGWTLSDRAKQDESRLFPTMEEFYREAIRVTERRGYQGEFQGNILAAVKGRIGTLLRGSKGKMFNCRKSIDIATLFSRPTVLELDSLNDDSKALTTLFLMILLREFRQTTSRSGMTYPLTDRNDGLSHLLLIEEAHRILENVALSANTEVTPDTRARAVRSVVDMLVEMRAYGQGILIAEQSPEKLAPDAVRNTNLKITHMLPGKQDRAAMAASMVMDEEQERYLGKLRVGQAAVFLTGMEKASFMSVPSRKDGSRHNDFLPDSIVQKHMQRFTGNELSLSLPYDGCRYCGQPCQHRKVIEPTTLNKRFIGEFHAVLAKFDEQPEQEYWSQHWCRLAQICSKAAESTGSPGSVDAAYCFLVHEIDFPFTEHMRTSFVEGYSMLSK